MPILTCAGRRCWVDTQASSRTEAGRGVGRMRLVRRKVAVKAAVRTGVVRCWAMHGMENVEQTMEDETLDSRWLDMGVLLHSDG